MASDKKHMSCQDMFERFGSQEKVTPLDLSIKDKENGEGENVELLAEPNKLQVALNGMGPMQQHLG